MGHVVSVDKVVYSCNYIITNFKYICRPLLVWRWRCWRSVGVAHNIFSTHMV